MHFGEMGGPQRDKYLLCARARVCALQTQSHLTLSKTAVLPAQLQHKLKEANWPKAPGTACDRGGILVTPVWFQSPCSETQNCCNN